MTSRVLRLGWNPDCSSAMTSLSWAQVLNLRVTIVSRIFEVTERGDTGLPLQNGDNHCSSATAGNPTLSPAAVEDVEQAEAGGSG